MDFVLGGLPNVETNATENYTDHPNMSSGLSITAANWNETIMDAVAGRQPPIHFSSAAPATNT